MSPVTWGIPELRHEETYGPNGVVKVLISSVRCALAMLNERTIPYKRSVCETVWRIDIEMG
jgi:hypothetical protein